MIAKSKRDYPSLTKILLYTNQEWGQGKADTNFNTKAKVKIKTNNDLKIKEEVEQKAKDSGIEIEWRTSGFFESPIVAIDNEKIAKHFFILDTSIFDLLKEKQRHTESLLFDIQTDIGFQGRKIEIDRGEVLNRLRMDRPGFQNRAV